jgi:DNA-binding CsgD family transcriptional regulator
VDQWRSAVNHNLKDLLGADTAGFLMPVEDGLMLYSDEHDPAELARYQDVPPPPTIEGISMWEHMVRGRVGTNARMFGDQYHLYLESSYYQDYAGANGAHDTLYAATSLGGVDARGMAAMHFWHAKPTGRRFEDREIALLKLLHPAFQAGVDAQLRWGRHRSTLLDTLDALGQAILVNDISGTRLHQTPALTDLLGADPEAGTLVNAMKAAAEVVRRMVSEKRSDPGAAGPCRTAMHVRTAVASYAIRASLYGFAPVGSAPVILVAVERTTPLPLSAAELRAAFGLTNAEARVAGLIARGHSNAEVARALYISPHTARRHTESVLRKLGIRSRTAVAARLSR